MNEPEDHVRVPDFQQAPDNQWQEVNVFIDLMEDAFEQDAPFQVFQTLIQEAPVVMSVDDYYWLAHSCVTQKHFRLDVLRLLLQREPEIAKHSNVLVDDEGHLLLHRVLVSEVTSVEAIQLILDANPSAIVETCENGKTALHLACQFCAPIEMIRFLLSRYPGAASTVSGGPDIAGLPIHVALEHSEYEHVISALLDAVPVAASIEAEYGWLALHIACMNGCSIELVKRLVEAYPEGVSIQDSDGNLPLFYACCSPAFEVVKFLLDKHPEGIRTRNNDGLLPLHSAAEADNTQLVQYVIDLYPEAVNITDHHGCLPLHNACHSTGSRDVIQLLLDRYNGNDRNHRGLSVIQYRGRLPLHCHCHLQRGTHTDVLQYLIALYPQGIHVADRDGMLPLHVACEYTQHGLNVTRVLVEADLYATVHNSRRGTPYQMVCSWQNRRNVELEAFLFEKQNEAVAALKEACESVTATQLGLPDLVVANIWSFAKPYLWTPDA